MPNSLEMPKITDIDEEITDEALSAAEDQWADEDRYKEDQRLGAFDEDDYADRIADWEFRSLDLEVGESLDVVGYYRRPLGAEPGTKWERIGHSHMPNALDLRRLLYCAEQRDARDAREEGAEEEAAKRRRLIEDVFGAGTRPLLDALITQSSLTDDAPLAPLTPRQNAFCRHYLSEPSGTRAAIMAGYAEAGASVEANRLLRNAKILAKISALRRERALSYTLDRDTVLDKLEWVFDEAMEAKSHSAALRALLAQAELCGLLRRRHAAAERAEAKARADVAEPAAVLGNDDK